MDLRAIFMGLAFALMWSSAFTSARIIVSDAPPLYSLSLRFLISGLLGVIIARALGQSWQLTRNQWRAVIIFGFCQNALYLGLNFVAMQWIEAGLASIIASTMPLMVALAGWILLGDRLRPMAVAGLFAGIIGVALIMGSRLSGGVDITGVILCFVAAAALTAATLSVRTASSGGNLMMIVGLQMFIGAGALFIAALFLESPAFTPSLRLASAFTYTVLVPGLMATWVWFTLVGRIGAIKAATFHFLNPFFGVAIAWLLLGEALSVVDFIGVAIITVGILAVQLSKQNPTET
ncbi:putative amino-acid metabolite efflux pump [Aliiroseovarius pelagivivens]|uniref:Putative amino-acid metabolite efflux pump n=1 Tax=Aliiroseovarius pelagivivens TaxID=1639690 RepID=A0A2R8ASW2_9RHOB|nr:DMT family transporter [Aliiroseovarius pelagivivens]SPF79143.1 putative amino-acid metabolite efflux pump [Aliiroseovarius pelagivivens]